MKTCDIEGCERRTWQYAKYCSMHRSRFYRYGSPDLPAKLLRVKPSCAVEGCEKQVIEGKYCSMHRIRIYRHGSPDITLYEMHGDAPSDREKRTAEYSAWQHILQRCTNPKSKSWKNYGARGITICDRWQNSYVAFLQDVGRRPSPKHSIDRIDNGGNYEPGNVRWATAIEQMHNQRRNRMVTYRGITQCVAAWAEQVGISFPSMLKRVRKGRPLDAPKGNLGGKR